MAKTYFRKIFSMRFLLCCSGDLSAGNYSEKTFVAICGGFHLVIQLIAWPIIYCLKTRSCILIYIKMYIEMFCIFVLYNTVKYLRIQVICIIFSSIINGSHLGFVCEIWVKFFQRPTKWIYRPNITQKPHIHTSNSSLSKTVFSYPVLPCVQMIIAIST